MSKKSNIFAAAEAVHAVCLILAVKVIAPVCGGMVETAAGTQVPMRCHYTGNALLLLGTALFVNAVLCAVRKEMAVCGAMAVMLSVLTFLTLSSSVGMGIASLKRTVYMISLSKAQGYTPCSKCG